MKTAIKSLKNGFTLIELMIVIVIIAILAALAIPAYEDYMTRSRVSEAFNIASKLETPIAEIAQAGLSFSTNSTMLSNLATANTSQYITSTQISTNYGVIVVTFGNTNNTAVDGKKLALVPYYFNSSTSGTVTSLSNGTVVSNPINWKCKVAGTADVASEGSNNDGLGTANLPAKYAPSACK